MVVWHLFWYLQLLEHSETKKINWTIELINDEEPSCYELTVQSTASLCHHSSAMLYRKYKVKEKKNNWLQMAFNTDLFCKYMQHFY